MQEEQQSENFLKKSYLSYKKGLNGNLFCPENPATDNCGPE